MVMFICKAIYSHYKNYFKCKLCTLIDLRFLASGDCPLVSEAGLEACVGFLVGGAGAFALVVGAESWHSGGQGGIKWCV